MALNREQAQQKVKEILDLARNEKKTLTYQDVMNKLSDLDIDADAIDAVFETLESEGINVINATEDETAVLPADVTGTDMDLSVPEGISIDEPTLSMVFSVNTSPFAGREGKFVTSRQIRERLMKETLKDVSLRVSDSDTLDAFNVAGRGEMHLSILIETMRREGYELSVSTPRVLTKEIDGVLCEPVERLVVDVPADSVGSVMQSMGVRKGEMISMHPIGNRTRLEFLVPSRGLFGYRGEFMTDTKGEGIMNSTFDSYKPYFGDIPRRTVGSLVAWETGPSITYGLFNAQERGTLFIGAGVPVYEGMIVGVSPKAGDIVINVCKKKHLTNTRASGSDDALHLIPPKQMSLEECLDFIQDDELVEVTPKSIRMRKIILERDLRLKAEAKKK